MKVLLLFLFFCQFIFAETAIDPRYDNYDGETLVLKLIEDGQWSTAASVFASEKDHLLKKVPAEYYLIQGLFQQHNGAINDSLESYEMSLSKKYLPLAQEKALGQYALIQGWDKGIRLLESHQANTHYKNLAAEIAFLTLAATNSQYLVRALAWAETYLKTSFNFPLFKFYIQELVKNKITYQSAAAVENAIDQGKIKTAEEVLTLTESFLVLGLEMYIHGFLEKSRLRFPGNDLIKLNLAQVLFKKDMYYSALNLLSELKTDDGVLNVQLELMNIMRVKSYSLFHRMNLQDNNNHLKNWFVYFINNEDWSLLYSLNTRYSTETLWKNDEFNYAMAYSAQTVGDHDQAKNFVEQITSPTLEAKKTNLLKSLNL